MTISFITGDSRKALQSLDEQSVHCCVTSPPYFGLRDYNHPDQIGLERTPAEYIDELVLVMREVRRVLRRDGTLWLNLGDSYAGNGAAYGDSKSTLQGTRQSDRVGARRQAKAGPGLKPKDLIGIPWRVALALQADGWFLRQDIIWSKPNPMPESVRDRCTKSHEYLFLLSRSAKYYFDQAAIAERLESSSIARLSQAVEAQTGSSRVPGKTNGTMRAVGGSRRNSFARKTKATAGEHGQKPQHRPEREDVDYSGTRNRRSVWTVPTKPFTEAHFATFPPALADPCVRAGAPVGGLVLDPFAGSGTTGEVCVLAARNAVLVELNPDYMEIARRRVAAARRQVQALRLATAQQEMFPVQEVLP